MKNEKPKTIVWAIDPFEAARVKDPSIIQELEAHARDSDLEIVPVYVDMEARLEELVSRPSAKKAIEQYLRDLGVHRHAPAQVLSEVGTSRVTAAARLIAFAREKSAEMILVSSHGRSGLERFVMGSFAEAVLFQSPVPVLFLSRQTSKRNPKRILFATDFSDQSNAAFDQILRYSKQTGSELILFHQISLLRSVQSVIGAPTMVAYPSETLVNEQIKWSRDQFAKWRERAVRLGVGGEGVITESESDIARSILDLAEKKEAGLIAMASQSGRVSSVLLGSVAKGVFRAGTVPIWVFGPKAGERIAA